MKTLRLRQAVVAASDRDGVVARWTAELGLGTPFHDPGVGEFGLCNSVVPVGDGFLEVVTPLAPGAGSAAERFMQRLGGDCGYMAILQVADMDEARAHVAGLGIRSVLDIDLDDIRCTHVHPADIGGAIVSFDQATPPESWRWAGPDWPNQVRSDVIDGLAGVVLASPTPTELLQRWSAALAVAPTDDTLLLGDGSYVEVKSPAVDGRTGLVGIDLWAAPGVAERSFDVAGVEFRIVARRGAAVRR